ncbi:MAG TPA: serine hydrolase [Micromonosporaceae bacterium]
MSTVADNLTGAVQAYLSGADGRVGVLIVDRATGIRVGVGEDRSFITASVVKVDILATLMLRRQDHGGLTDREDDLARAMITRSDNDAASALWTAVGGGTGVTAANQRFGLSHTHPDQDGYWGLSTTTAADQVRLLGLLTSSNSPLNAHSRSYILGLMSQVERDQRWGVPAAAGPASTGVYVKNGWLAYNGGWVTHSVGRIVEPGHDWLLAVLSDGQPSEGTGIDTIEHVASLVVAAERAH